MTFHLQPTRRFLLGLLASTALPSFVSAQVPKSGGTLIVAAEGEQRNLNPAIVASNAVFFVSAKVIEPLFDMQDGGGFAPRLALSASPAPDGLAIAFNLRPNVTWHDGKPFTSADVAFSAMQVWKPLQNIGRSLLKDLDAVETPDPLTAIFRFSKPMPFDLLMNALPAISSVLPKHLYDGTDIAINPHNMKPVGTGPFVFDSHQPNVDLRLRRNPNYWDKGKPYLDGIVYRSIPDRSTIAASLEKGEIQLAAFSPLPLTEMQRMSKLDGIAVIPQGYDGITYQIVVEMNHRRKELQDVRVRRAVAHAIDQSLVVRTIFMGYAKPAKGPIPAFDKNFHDETLVWPAFDKARAEALLDEAGYRRGADGSRFSLKLLPAPWFEQTKQFGAYLRQALKAVGINAEIIANDAAAHLKAVYTDGAFDLAIGSPVYRNDPAISTTILYEGGLPAGVPFANQYGYRSEAMDAVIRRGAITLDKAERAKVYREFQKLALDDMPLIPVVEFTFLTIARKIVGNVANNPRWATSHWADCWLSA